MAEALAAIGGYISTAWGAIGAAGQAAVIAAASAGASAAIKQNNEVKGEGNLLDLQINASAPRQLVIGKHMIGGTLVDWFVSGSDNNLLKLVVYLSEGPCGNIKRVFGGGREVWSGTMTHGVRTPITEYKDGGNGSTLLHITYYDGREGQSAPSALVGSGWSSNNKMTGCAYVVVEASWTRSEMPSPPTLTYELEGVKLYDRRKDTTAGGSGSHRLDTVSTWEFSNNPMVVLDHYLLGRYWGDQRVMGIGLDPEQVPYDRFAAMANICDEDVTTLSGGTQKRYRANGGIWANSYYGDVIKDLCKAMAARPADFGGRIGVIGSETRSPVLTIDDGDLIEGLPEVYTPKRQWTELVGAVEGRYKDPDNLYQDVDYPRISDDDWEDEDGGEPRVETLDLNFETDIERAQRLALLYAKRERRQATLQGTYPPYAIELEQGDWFIRTGDRWGEDGKTFEVLTRVVDAASLLVTITAFEVDASDSAWSADMASPKPADAIPNSMLLGYPEVPVITASGATVSGTNSTLPALLVSWDELTDTRIEYLVIEVYQTSDDKRIATVNVNIPDDDNSTTIVGGIVEGVSYYVRARSVTGSSKSDWSDDDSATSTGDYIASSINNQGWGATAPRDEVENAEITPDIVYNTALIAAETATRISEDGALASDISALQASTTTIASDLNGVETEITTLATKAEMATVESDLEGALATSEATTAASYQAADAALQADINDVSGDLTDLSTVVDSKASTSELATASATAADATATLEASVNASIAAIPASTSNLVQFSEFDQGVKGWSAAGVSVWANTWRFVYQNPNFSAAGQYTAIRQDSTNGYRFSVTSGSRLAVRAGFYATGPIANVRLYVTFMDTSGGFISGTPIVDSKTGTQTFNTVLKGFIDVPSGAVSARMEFYAYSNGAGAGYLGVTQPLVSLATSQQTSVPAYSEGPNAEAGADVTENSDVFVALDASVTVVQVSTASLEETSAIFDVIAAASGSTPARIRLRAGVGGSSVILDGDQIYLGDDTDFETTYNTFVTDAGDGWRKRYGAPFPASGDLVEWYGPSSVALNSETRLNGYWAQGTDGKIYYGNSELGTAVGLTATIAGTKSYNVPSAQTVNWSNIATTASNGSGSYSYSWSHVSGTNLNITSTTISSPDFSYYVNGTDVTGTYELKVIDNGNGDVILKRLTLAAIWTG